MTNVINDTKHNFWFNNIDWIKVNKVVINIQFRIFVAKKKRSFRKLKKLKNLILSSKSNKLFAIKKVFKLNKKIYSFNNNIYFILKEKIKLIEKIYEISINNWEPTSIKHFYIIKRRYTLINICILKLIDYILQVIIKNTLEPEFKTKFKSLNCFFKNNKYKKNKIIYFYNIFKYKKKKNFILYVNIQNFFYSIYNKFLINKLSHFPAKKLILKWLKSGYINKYIFNSYIFNNFIYNKYTISTILINIAFYGIKESLGIIKTKYNKIKPTSISIINADNFIIFCNKEKEAIKIKKKISFYLKKFNLDKYLNKINLINTIKNLNFLGFNIKIYKLKNLNKLCIKPSMQSQITLRKKLKKIWKKSLGLSLENVINKINFIIKIWVNYFNLSEYYKLFTKIYYYNFIRQYKLVKRNNRKNAFKYIKVNY